MSDMVRCYLDAKNTQYEQFQEHLTQRYYGQQIDIRYEQDLVFHDSFHLFTFLVTLPDVKRGDETHYQRRIFLSYLPIEISSVIYLEHIAPDMPISEHAIKQVQEWLGMSKVGRLMKRQSLHQYAIHNGPDVPLISGNMREE